jgi:hypothetical protein
LPRKPKGLQEFCERFPEARPVIVGAQGVSLAEFFLMDLQRHFL